MSQIYSMEFPIRSYEVGALGAVKTSFVFRYLQEIAREHAAALGVSVLDLQKRGLTWYISRYHLQMDECPGWGEKLIIDTWPSERQKLFLLRDFEIKNSSGKLIGRATSSWVVVDIGRKRPVPPSKALPEIEHNPKRAIDDTFFSLPVAEEWDVEKEFIVRMQNIDVNKHVNNVVYIEWAIETIPENILKITQPTDIEISFKGEAFYNDMVISRSKVLNDEDKKTYIHQIVRKGDGKELARLKTNWT
ncbi:MAG: hypothetical protein KAR38_02740 [Calditrichia bacterium]|nr:hypothetical protein [Calditrichia bacterium]